MFLHALDKLVFYDNAYFIRKIKNWKAIGFKLKSSFINLTYLYVQRDEVWMVHSPFWRQLSSTRRKEVICWTHKGRIFSANQKKEKYINMKKYRSKLRVKLSFLCSHLSWNFWDIWATVGLSSSYLWNDEFGGFASCDCWSTFKFLFSTVCELVFLRTWESSILFEDRNL